MEMLSKVALNQSLTFLYWVTAVFLIVIGGFLTKFLYDLIKLTKNLNITTEIVNTELKPTINELKETLHSVNSIIKSTDQSVDSLKSAVGSTLNKTKNLSDSIIGGILKGFTTVLGLLENNLFGEFNFAKNIQQYEM